MSRQRRKEHVAFVDQDGREHVSTRVRKAPARLERAFAAAKRDADIKCPEGHLIACVPKAAAGEWTAVYRAHPSASVAVACLVDDGTFRLCVVELDGTSSWAAPIGDPISVVDLSCDYCDPPRRFEVDVEEVAAVIGHPRRRVLSLGASHDRTPNRS